MAPIFTNYLVQLAMLKKLLKFIGVDMATIVINGQKFTGNNVNIVGGRVIIDGVEQLNGQSGVLEVRVTEGTLGELKADGSVTCGSVTGNVAAGGSVNCDDVGGNVSAGGSVNCDNVGGRISAGGSVRMG